MVAALELFLSPSVSTHSSSVHQYQLNLKICRAWAKVGIKTLQLLDPLVPLVTTSVCSFTFDLNCLRTAPPFEICSNYQY